MTIGTRLFTWLKGEMVGKDQMGNRYFQEKKAAENGHRRRWVLYSKGQDASSVPPQWHGWMHHTVDQIPADGENIARPWQKEHMPNLTGTMLAYRPPGHLLKGGKRDKATGDYEAWKPE